MKVPLRKLSISISLSVIKAEFTMTCYLSQKPLSMLILWKSKLLSEKIKLLHLSPRPSTSSAIHKGPSNRYVTSI